MNKLRKFLREFHQFFLLTAVIGILIDIFAFPNINDLLILSLIVLWVVGVIGSQSEKKLSILASIILLAAAPFFLIVHLDKIAEKIAIWAYMFLAVGIVKQLVEFKKVAFKDEKKD